MKYAVLIEKGPTSFGATVPDLPGLFAVAETLDELRTLVAEAIEFHIECLVRDGDTVPEPTVSVEMIDVPADDATTPTAAERM